MEKPVIIFGAKGIAKAALDIFQSHGVVVYGFLDDDPTLIGQEINHIPILGSTENEDYLKLIGKECEAFVAIDETSIRENIVDLLLEERKTMPVNAIHRQAIVSEAAYLGHGNFINAGAVIGMEAKISNHCLVHSGAIVEHEVEASDFVQIGTGAIVNSGAKIGTHTFIGSGVTVVSGVEIGKNARIGAGSVVVQRVNDHETVFGNPATVVKS